MDGGVGRSIIRMVLRALLAVLLVLPASAQVTVEGRIAAPATTVVPVIGSPLTSPAALAAPSVSLLAPSVVPPFAPSDLSVVAPVALSAAKPTALKALTPAASKARSPVQALKTAVAGFGEKLATAPKALATLFEAASKDGDVSGPVVVAETPKRRLSDIRSLRVGTYNVLNLFSSVGQHVPDPETPGKLKKVSDAKPKEDWSLRAQGQVILENRLDVVTLEEVEDIAALRDFNERFLEGKYDVYLIEGNDERGIDIGFLVKKDLPFVVEQRSHKDETWVDPVFGGGPTKLFSRDFTALVVRAEPGGKPLFLQFGTHFKSKRDRDGKDPESRVMRGAQVARAAEIVGRYRAEFGQDVPILLSGDFNGEVPNEPEFKPLFEAAGLTDAFDATPNPPSDRDRVTHTFHPRGGASHYGQMDAVLVSKGLRGAVTNAMVYRYKNDDGSARDVPHTYEEREKNPSDHFPVVVTLDFAPIRDGFVPAWTQAPKPAPKADDGFVEYAYDHLEDRAEGVFRDRLLSLVKTYMRPEKPSRLAAYVLSVVYYDGLDVLRGLPGLDAEAVRQVEEMLKVLDGVVPRAAARPNEEPEINRLVNTFMRLLGEFDRRGDPPPAVPTPLTPGEHARVFADGLKSWLADGEAGWDAKMAQWLAWTDAPTPGVNAYTTRNLPEVKRRLLALKAAKAAFKTEALRVPPGDIAPEAVRPLFDAWAAMGRAVNDVLALDGDSFDRDLSKRGLIANVDQNTGKTPGGLETFVRPTVVVDWDAVRAVGSALSR